MSETNKTQDKHMRFMGPPANEFATWMKELVDCQQEADEILDQAEELYAAANFNAMTAFAFRTLLWERNRVLAILRAEMEATSKAMADGSQQVTAEGVINSLIAQVEAKEKEGTP